MSDFRGLIGPGGVALLGRTLIALLFILAGIAKIVGPKPFLDHMREFAVPIQFLPAVIALEVGAGIALLLGWRVRDTAGLLGLFCILAAVIFHRDLANKVERSTFLKDLAIAGGLLAMAAQAALASGGRRRLKAHWGPLGRGLIVPISCGWYPSTRPPPSVLICSTAPLSAACARPFALKHAMRHEP